MENNFLKLESYVKLGELDTGLQGQVKSVYERVSPIINNIPACYTNYTLHDMGHSIRVIQYMEQIAFHTSETTIDDFDALELTMIILTGLLHDIGMFIDEKDNADIPNNVILYNRNELTYEGMLQACNNSKEDAIKEIVRQNHASRVEKYINFGTDKMDPLSSLMKVDGLYDYSDDVIQICKSHCENFDFITKSLKPSITKGSHTYNQQYVATLLRIADYLDFDKRRTPILWFNIFEITGYSQGEWEKHFIIENEKKFKDHYGGKKQIFFQGTSSNPKIHRKYLAYIDSLRRELENADRLLNNEYIKKKYNFNIMTSVDDMVNTDGFECSDLRLALDYSSITELLMGKNIYGNSKYGLRELIQNSIDACKLAKEALINEVEDSNPSIYIIVSKKNNTVKIKDTGIGMTLDVIKNHFLNIGKSYYKSNEYIYKNYKYKPIGQFGIGFLACFLLSDDVTVTTKYYNQPDVITIELSKKSEYVVTKKNHDDINFKGTTISLNYDQFFNVFVNKDNVFAFVKNCFVTEIPIFYFDEDDMSKERINTVIDDDELKKRFDVHQSFSVINVKEEEAEGRVLSLKSPHYRNKYIDVVDFKNHVYYLFDNKEKVFKKIEALDTNYYYCILYSGIDNKAYNKLSKNRQPKQITNALSKDNCYPKVLLIFERKDYSYIDMFISYDGDKENNISDIFEKSNLAYIPYLLDSRDFVDKYFVHEKKGVVVFSEYVNWYRGHYQSYEIDDESYNNHFCIYYKDVLIRDADLRITNMPYHILVSGYINYHGADLKLDVSRRKINSGSEHLSELLRKILINYYLENANKGRSIVKKMLEFDEKQKNMS